MAATPPSNRKPPHDLQAEESLLGAMLLKRDAIAAAERLNASDFYSIAHGNIFTAIVALDTNGAPVDPVTVADELRASGLLDQVGGPNRLVALITSCPATSNSGRYAKIIEDCAVLRRLIGAAGEIAEAGYEGAHDVAAAVDRAESLVFEVGQRRTVDTTLHAAELLDQSIEHLEELFERGERVTGTPTGFLDLDELLGGFQDGTLNIIGARPSAGKTALALSIATHAAIGAQRPVLVFSLEMAGRELMGRMISAEARVDSKRIRNGDLTDQDWRRVADATGKLADAPIWIDDNPTPTLMEIRSKARKLQSKHGKLGMVVVDYLQLMTGQTGNENLRVEVSAISRGLKILAREMQCPVLVLSQLSRGLEMRADRRPMLSDLKESGSIEQDADVVMFVYRDEMYRDDSPDQGIAEVIVAKHRNGATGTVKLSFLAHYTKFANMARRAA